LGIDQAGGVIEIGRQRIKATGLKGRVEVSSYGEAGSFGEFDAVVSLQGITRYLTHGDFAQLRSLCSLVATGGHLLLVERPPESNRELDACLRDMGLGLIGVGNAGGMCINSDFGSYLCLLLKKGESSSVGILEAEEESVRLWENHFKVFANRDLGIDWTLRNWAYCWAEGAPYLRRFE